jgi:membrane fusion protein, multidrug efflux system
MTTLDVANSTHRPVERWASFGIIMAAVLLSIVVFRRADHHPRTDDAEVFANLIGIAPQVEGPIVQLEHFSHRCTPYSANLNQA